VTVADASGQPVTLSFTQSSQTTVLYIFSPTCKWCEANLRNIQALSENVQHDSHTHTIGLSISENGFTNYAAHRYLNFPLYDKIPKSFLAKYRLGITPETLVLVDGKIVKDWKGVYTHDAQRQIEIYFHVRLPGL
jgi:hypothetical protein